jgi:DNA (cytosine-5)-methyltransferase 1
MSTGTAYYNENDPKKAAWLRELIKADIIAPGEVDERSIMEIRPNELRNYRQCHFFAGIGVWSYALRLAGWPDNRPVWSGSCPCPSFSAAGKGKGFADPRHLWPHWASLIRECRPATVFGEQVASAIGHGWLDLVYVDLEAAAYSVGAAVLGACGVGAPHIRQRLYFGVHAEHSERRPELEIDGTAHRREGFGWSSDTSGSSHTEHDGRRPNIERRPAQERITDGRDCETGFSSDTDGGIASNGNLQRGGEQRLLAEYCGTGDGSDSTERGLAVRGSASGIAGHAALTGESGISDDSISPRLEGHFGDVRDGRGPGWLDPQQARSVAAAGATRGFWADCDWWYGKDGKYRPIEPGIFPLAHGASNRVLKLRGYGDAICAPVAAEFITAFSEVAA